MKVDVVIPVYNEECKLERSIHALRQHFAEHARYDWRIVIADNASVDRTWAIAHGLSGRFADVAAFHLDQKGRGLALRAAWTASTASIVSYMDVDLSTDLSAFVPMIDSVAAGQYDVAVGSRLSRGSQVARCLKREVVSRGYNLLVSAFFPGKQFSDAQIGFKALTIAAAREVLPLVKNNYWFFDTELLVQAQRRGYRIGNIPVRWTEDPDSRVKVGPAAMENIKGLVRLRFSRAA